MADKELDLKEFERSLKIPSPVLDAPTPMATLVKPTQDNVARAFEMQYGADLRFCSAWGKWLIWDNCRWREERTQLAFDYSRILARMSNPGQLPEAAKASFARGVETFARASRTFATLPEDWDRNEFLLNTPAGTTDLEKWEIGKHRKTDYLTKNCRVSPERGPHPVFDRFLRDITLEDSALAEYHQRALGACLSGAISDNFLLFWYGTGQNGKNTFGDLIEWILGDYAKVIPVETLMASRSGTQHPTDLANLRGARLAISSEVEEGSHFNEQRIKSLTGDANISARFMRQDFFEFRRTHKHLVYGNHRPMLRAVDPAIRSRLHIVPFKAHFPPDARDPQMADKLRAEAPQILQWLIDGHEAWMEDGYLKKCSSVQSETEAYFGAQSTPEMWLVECCELDPAWSVRAGELYRSYKTWKELRGEGVLSQFRWGEWMGHRFDKKPMRGYPTYFGVRLQAEGFSRITDE